MPFILKPWQWTWPESSVLSEITVATSCLHSPDKRHLYGDTSNVETILKRLYTRELWEVLLRSNIEQGNSHNKWLLTAGKRPDCKFTPITIRQGFSSDQKNSKFQSGHRVVKMVLNTWYYVYIYGIQSDRMHSFQSKHSNLENRCFHYIRPQKSPKIAQKSNHSIAIFSIFQ